MKGFDPLQMLTTVYQIIFLKVFYNKAAFIWSKIVILWNIIKISDNCSLFEYILSLFLWCKAVFSASLLQSSVSHDPQKSV